jgi:hypothetical protein
MNSPGLHGIHPLTPGLLVEVNTLYDRQGVFQLQPNQDPVNQRGTQFAFAFPPGSSEGDDSLARWKEIF